MRCWRGPAHRTRLCGAPLGRSARRRYGGDPPCQRRTASRLDGLHLIQHAEALLRCRRRRHQLASPGWRPRPHALTAKPRPSSSGSIANGLTQRLSTMALSDPPPLRFGEHGELTEPGQQGDAECGSSRRHVPPVHPQCSSTDSVFVFSMCVISCGGGSAGSLWFQYSRPTSSP